MVSTKSKSRFAHINFRVLIIGRANAGKTSILQRVCDTTESPAVYKTVGGRREQIRLEPTQERGKHDIRDELIFANHDGYIFHDSRGFESGGESELETIQEFVREKASEKRLKDRLHAIWYCIPMDNNRPSLDAKGLNAVCPDKNVPIIAVFTKYDYFKDATEVNMEDNNLTEEDIEAETERVFNEQYLRLVEGASKDVRLENMNQHGQRCDVLIEATVDVLQDDAVAVMLLAVQQMNLERAISVAVKRLQ